MSNLDNRTTIMKQPMMKICNGAIRQYEYTNSIIPNEGAPVGGVG